MSTDAQIEAEIVAKGKTAARITPADIDANIASEHYFTAYGGAKYGRITRDEPEDSDALKLLTFCVLVLRNGFTVTGESACASPENFDAEIGRKVARANAMQKIWPLMGYELKSQLANVIEYTPFTWEDVLEIQSTTDALSDGTMFRIKAKAGNEFNFVIADTSKMSQLQIKDQIIIRINQQIQKGAKP